MCVSSEMNEASSSSEMNEEYKDVDVEEEVIATITNILYKTILCA